MATRLRAAPFLALAMALAQPALAGPRVTGGTPTAVRPAVGAVRVGTGKRAVTCTGVVVGCSTVVTSAACLCPDDAPCDDPAGMRVFLESAGWFDVDAVAADAPDGVAVLTLAGLAMNVAPLPLAAAVPSPGTLLGIVGWGATETVTAPGLVHEGGLTTTACPGGADPGTTVCWAGGSGDATPCAGDGGAPLLHPDGTVEGLALAGACDAGAAAQAVAVAPHAAFVADAAMGDLGYVCTDGPAVGEEGTGLSAFTGTVDRDVPEAQHTVVVPEETGLLRVGLHAPDDGRTEIDLYVQWGDGATTDLADCIDDADGPWAFCEIAYPDPGVWSILVHRRAGGGPYQLTVVTIPPGDGGFGDWPECGNGVVEEGEECEPDDASACTGGCDEWCYCRVCTDGGLALSQVQLAPRLLLRGHMAADDGSLLGFDPRQSDLVLELRDAAGHAAVATVPAGDPGWRGSKASRGLFRWRGRADGLRKVQLRDRTARDGGWSVAIDGRAVPGAGAIGTDGLSVQLRSDPACVLKRF